MHVSSNYNRAASIPMAYINFEPPKVQKTSPTNKQLKFQQFKQDFSAARRPEVDPAYYQPQPDNFKQDLFTSKIQYMESSLREDQQQSPHSDTHHSSLKSTHSPSTNTLPPMRASLSDQYSVTPSQYMSFYDYEEAVHLRAGRLIAAGPLSLASIVKKDPFLRVNLMRLRQEQRMAKNHWAIGLKTPKELVKEILIDDNTKGSRASTLVDEKFSKTLIENEGIDEIKVNREGTKRQLGAHGSHIFNLNRADYETETILQIQEALPDEKLIWILVDNYFNSTLSAFMPMVSEIFFKEKMVEIIGPRKDRKSKIDICITRRFDFAYMGILLIILRLTSLSVTKTSHSTPQEEYILANPIGLNAVNVAQMCLNQFRVLRRGAVPIIQCCLFMRFYHKYAPEDGDGSDGGDGQVFLGMLLQMANSIGLNRDLSHSASLKDNSKLCNLWRMIWHEIVSLDLRQSLVLGDPILIDENYYDTLLPFLETKVKDQMTTNFEIHSSVIDNFHMNDEINKIIRDILKLILNIKTMLRVDELNPKLKRLENFVDENFKDINSILLLKNFTLQDTISKLFKFINYIELKTSLYVIYYHIFLRFPNNHSMFLKMVDTAMELNSLVYLMITTNNQKTDYFDSIFGSGSQLIIIPTLITSLQKTHQVQVGLISRCLDIKFNHKDFKNHAIVCKILQETLKKFDILKDGFQSLCSDYFHAWRTTKALNRLSGLFTNLENNIWDRSSEENSKLSKDTEAKDYFKNMQGENELMKMSDSDLNRMLEITSTSKYEEVLMVLLNRAKLNNISGTTIEDKERSYQHFIVAPTVYPEHAQYQPLPYPATQAPPEIASITSLLNDNNGEATIRASSPCQKGLSDPKSLHVNKSCKTDLEIDRLWIQMIANNNTTLLDKPAETKAVFNERSFFEDDEKLLSASGIGNGGTATASSLDNPRVSQPNDDLLHIISGTTSTNVSNPAFLNDYNIFEPNTMGLKKFDMADIDRFMGEASLYDIFGDVPFNIDR
jgi:hypothetical protein